jgi:2-iminobutanoate/2-iminopropanoate deaminase
MGKIRIVSPDVAEGEPGTYSQAFRAGRLLFVNGQIGVNAVGELVSEDVEAQTRQALANVRSLVQAADGAMGDLVKLSIFVTDIAYRPAVVRVRREFFSGDFPCSTLVAVSALAFGAKVEIEGIAYLSG